MLTVYDRQGKVVRTIGERAVYSTPAFSPDGKRLAVEKLDVATQNHDIWVFDLSTGASTRITSDPAWENWPVWSPDGTQIVYASNPGGSLGLYRKAADGTGNAEFLYKPSANLYNTDWSPDGRFLTYHDNNSWYVLPLTGPGEQKAIEVVSGQGRAGGGRGREGGC